MSIRLKLYLARLQDAEQRKPPEVRREVPTLRELATVADITPQQMSNIVNNKGESLSFEFCRRIMGEMRRRGFSIQTTDIIDFEGEGENQ
jgi:hypothetical protein